MVRWLKRPLILVPFVLITAAAIYLAITLAQVWLASRQDGARHAQAIVVLGAAQYNGRPSPVLAARLDHALDLYHHHVADTIFVTGGKQPGDRFTEASTSADYLIARGVPDTAILREISGQDSWQSLAVAALYLKKLGKTDVVLVSDPFHALRIGDMARELGLHATMSPTRTSPIKGIGALTYMTKEATYVAVGRVVGFRNLVGADHRLKNQARGGLRPGPGTVTAARSGVV